MSQVLRSGMPSVLHPISYDQFDNAYRMEQLGAALRIKKKELNPEILANRIESALSDEAMHRSVREVSNKVTRECGTTVATDAIEALL